MVLMASTSQQCLASSRCSVGSSFSGTPAVLRSAPRRGRPVVQRQVTASAAAGAEVPSPEKRVSSSSCRSAVALLSACAAV